MVILSRTRRGAVVLSRLLSYGFSDSMPDDGKTGRHDGRDVAGRSIACEAHCVNRPVVPRSVWVGVAALISWRFCSCSSVIPNGLS